MTYAPALNCIKYSAGIDGMIPGNQLYFVPTDSHYVFGVLVSRVHNAWTQVVAGRLKSDYNYGNTTVYTNLVWPDATPAERERIEQSAQGILEARAYYPDASLATLYDPDLMPAGRGSTSGLKCCICKQMRR